MFSIYDCNCGCNLQTDLFKVLSFVRCLHAQSIAKTSTLFLSQKGGGHRVRGGKGWGRVSAWVLRCGDLKQDSEGGRLDLYSCLYV